jgi:hypothetical protein
VFEKEGPGVKIAKLDCTQHQSGIQSLFVQVFEKEGPGVKVTKPDYTS